MNIARNTGYMDEPSVHLALVQAPFARMILNGSKLIESRLTRTRRVPFGRVKAGERVYFISRKAGLIVTAVIDAVESYSGMTPHRVRLLQAEFGDEIGAPDAYWEHKRDAKYATLIWLRGAELAQYAPDDVHGRERSYRSAWIVRPRSQCVYPACCKQLRASA